MRTRVVAGLLTLATTIAASNEIALAGNRDRDDLDRLIDRIELEDAREERLDEAIKHLEEIQGQTGPVTEPRKKDAPREPEKPGDAEPEQPQE